MKEIKVGTRVRIVKAVEGYITYEGPTPEGLFVGNTGTVMAQYNGSRVVFAVRTDNATEPTDGFSSGWSLYREEFEVIE